MSEGNSRRSSANSTPRVTPSVSALHSRLASPTAPLSRATSPKPLQLPQNQQAYNDVGYLGTPTIQTEVQDDVFAPTADPGLLSRTPDPQSSLDEVQAASLDPALGADSQPMESSQISRRPSVSASRLAAIVGEATVVSGGTGYNDLIGATPGPTTYVMPISDNGGSSSEIIRTLSGPSIGDIRSRLVRLIPLSTTQLPLGGSKPPLSNDALHALLSYRLPTAGRTRDIKSEWLDLLEGRHKLWRGIEADRKEVIRGFLVHFQSEILRRAHRNFNLRGLSVGNAFLSAAQKFFRSIQSAIFLFSATTLVAGSGAAVLPCINTNHTATIAAELEDGTTLVGQCEISHPARPVRRPGQEGSGSDQSRLQLPTSTYGQSNSHLSTGTEPSGMATPSSVIFDPIATVGSDFDAALNRSDLRRRNETQSHPGRRTVGNSEDGLSPEEDPGQSEDEGDDYADDDDHDSDARDEGHRGKLPTEEDPRRPSKPLAKSTERKQAGGNIVFSKGDAEQEEPLPSPIRNIYYINSYRNIVWPAPNPSYVSSLHRSRTLIYSCGSLWTSIIPSLALRGIGTSIACSSSLKYKVLLLNTSWDRETNGYTAWNFIDAITRTLNLSDDPNTADYHAKDYITHIVFYTDSQITLKKVEVEEELGIRCIEIPSQERKDGRPSKFSEEDVRWALSQIERDSDLH